MIIKYCVNCFQFLHINFVTTFMCRLEGLSDCQIEYVLKGIRYRRVLGKSLIHSSLHMHLMYNVGLDRR